MKKKIISLLIIVSVIVSVPTIVLAETDSDMNSGTEITVDRANFQNDADYHTAVETAINNPNVMGINAVDTRVIKNYKNQEVRVIEMDSLDAEKDGDISLMTVTTNVVKNVRKGDNTTGNLIKSSSGDPGGTLAQSVSKSIATTLSATFGATKSSISAAVGWSVTSSVTVSESYSYKIPKKVNGKKVKFGHLRSYPKLQVKYFDVYKRTRYRSGKVVETKKGTGNTKRCYGVYFKKAYTYY